MYIKYVRIHGFKSYREKTICGPLSPMHNSVVGYNGSGKSNFFAALRFVLSDAYSNMRNEERAKLLNEGAGQQITQAYVEITFDNSDRRLDNEREEVTIKRQIGLKKDEYFIDQKKATRQDIANMLETAGFSKSNPYYIVEQGKVTKITEMSDKQRLDLIKEVAGTNVYEEKKDESLKIMREAAPKMEEIDKNLKRIEDRLEKLNKEKEELAEYYNLDKERRSLHHALLTQKIRNLDDELQSIKNEKAEISSGLQSGDGEKERLQESEIDLDNALQNLADRLSELDSELGMLEKKEEEASTEYHETDSEINGMEAAMARFKKTAKENRSEVAKLEERLKKERKSLVDLEPKLQEMEAELEATNKQKNLKDNKVESLNSVQAGQVFSSQAQRDAHLQKSIKELEKKVQDGRDAIAKAEAEKDAMQKEIETSEANRKELQDGISDRKKTANSVQVQEQELKQQLVNKKKERQKYEATLSELTKKLEPSRRGANSNQSDKALLFLDAYVKDRNIKGYYGPVIDIFECKAEVYNTAVEQAAGARLFNAVVEDENTATVLMDALRKSGAGRMQFLPLKNLRPSVVKYPEVDNHSVLVMDTLKYDQKFRPAIQEVFGRTVVCRTFEVAQQVRRDHGLQTVTLDGSKIARKGAIKGGYYDTTQSTIKLRKQAKEEAAGQEKSKREAEGIEVSIRNGEQASAGIESKMQKLRAEREELERADVRDKGKIEDEKKKIGERQDSVKNKENNVKRNRELVNDDEHKIASLREQLAVPFAQKLTDAQEAELRKLTGELTELKRKWKTLNDQVNDLTQEKENKINEIQSDEKSLADLNDEFEEAQSSAVSDHQMKQEKARLREQKAELDSLRQRKEAATKEKDGLVGEERKKREKLKDVKAALEKHGGSFDASSKKLDQLRNRENRVRGDRDQAQAQLRELGAPPEAFEKYKDKRQKYLQDELQKVTEKLKGFKDVNKKAMDQFTQFTEQRGRFRDRKDELVRGDTSIKTLIETLNRRKDDALQVTYKMVADNFKEVFEQIVPGGEGELVLKFDDDDEPGAVGAGRKYVGVQVRVRFAAGGEVRRMRQLSGGQKSVVALAMIFAIQKCDPAPFYLFDEVDANLDPMYRAAIAKMVSRLKEGNDKVEGGVQFITSSFQEELVRAADCHWLVTHAGMSRFHQGLVQDQLDIVRKNQQTAQQAVQH